MMRAIASDKSAYRKLRSRVYRFGVACAMAPCHKQPGPDAVVRNDFCYGLFILSDRRSSEDFVKMLKN